MKPDLSRSDQVVARVVAWHNRHPLASKISADQVHSVGVVSLPFAVRGAQVAPISLALPTSAAQPEPVVIEVPSASAKIALPEAEDEFETEVELVVEPPAEPPPTATERPPAEAKPAAEPTPAPQPTAPDGELPRVTVVAMRAAQLPSRPRAWHPLTWWQRLRGRPTYRPLFSEDFIAPLRPRQVARWAAAHGVGARPLEPQAQQRLIMLDAARRLAGDDAPEVDLYLITAAIGAGDERKRLLLAPGSSSQVWGPRYWDRPRVAAAAGTSLALATVLVTGLLWQAGSGDLLALWRPGQAAVAASPASAVLAAPAKGASAAARPASGAAPTVLARADAASTPASSPSSAPASASASVAQVASEGAASQPTTRVAQAPAQVASATQVSAPADPLPRPESVRPRRGRIELQTLVPPLADADRQALRVEARQLRGPVAAAATAAPEPSAKAWALVTRPIDDRRQSERLAAQMQAVALLQPVPMRAELMPAGRGWRAAVWPFQSAKDAEKVRLALADKGLRTEVVEF